MTDTLGQIADTLNAGLNKAGERLYELAEGCRVEIELEPGVLLRIGRQGNTRGLLLVRDGAVDPLTNSSRQMRVLAAGKLEELAERIPDAIAAEKQRIEAAIDKVAAFLATLQASP